MAKLDSTIIYGSLSVTDIVNSMVGTGTAPLTINSTTLVPNLNADLLDGFHAATSATANTIVLRDTNGFINSNYININNGVENTTASNYLYDNGDGFIRKKSLANTKAEIVTSAAIISGLTYTPYNATNPSGYTTNTGTITASSSTTNYLTKFTGATAIGNSLIYDDGTNIGIGTTGATSRLSLGAHTPANYQSLLIYESGSTRAGLGLSPTGFRIFAPDISKLSLGLISTGDGTSFTEVAYISGGVLSTLTATGGTNTTQVATTAFVQSAISSFSAGATVDDTAPTGTVGKLWFEPDTGAFQVYAGGAWVSTTKNGLNGADGANGTGWTSGSYNSGTGVVTFSSTDGLGFATGDLRGAVTSDSVGYTQIATTLKGVITDNDGAYDFSAAGIIITTLSTTTSVTFTNLQTNKTLKMKLTITGSPTITFPSYCKKLAGSQTLAAGTFYLYFDCWESAGGSELVIYSIMKEE